MKKRFLILFLVLGLALIPSDVNATGPILPFRSGTLATFGSKGVHDCGYSLSGWKAVDLLPQENQVYASEGGTVDYVCRDSYQVAVRIGDHLYGHLKDTGQKTGDYYAQGQPMGELVTGPLDSSLAPCGYAQQSATTYHVHYCFIPNGSTYQVDGYTLDINNNTWTKNGQTVTMGQTVRADWSGVTPPPTATTGGGMFNLWDWLVRGIIAILTAILYPLMPPGTNRSSVVNAIGLANGLGNGVLMVLELTVAALSTFNWVLPLAAFGWNMMMWFIQLAISLYSFIMGLIKKIPFL